MHNRTEDFLSESQRQFLRIINYPMPIAPPVREGLDNPLWDELRRLVFPLMSNEHRKQFKG